MRRERAATIWKRATTILVVVLVVAWLIGGTANEAPQRGPTPGQIQGERKQQEEISQQSEEEQRQAGYKDDEEVSPPAGWDPK
jgi:hypothetical protein